MSFIELAKKRYSCKKFDGRKVEKEKLDIILEAGRLAPTAKNLQEQHIYVLESEEALEKVDACTPCRYGASTVLCIAFNTENVYTYPNGKRDSGIEDATIIATHIILAAADVDVDSCWINNFDFEKLKNELQLPENEEILMLMDLGYGDNFKPLPNHDSRKELTETVTYK